MKEFLRTNKKLRDLVNIYRTSIDNIDEIFPEIIIDDTIYRVADQTVLKTKKYLFKCIKNIFSPIWKEVKIKGTPFTTLIAKRNFMGWALLMNNDYAEDPLDYSMSQLTKPQNSDFNSANLSIGTVIEKTIVFSDSPKDKIASLHKYYLEWFIDKLSFYNEGLRKFSCLADFVFSTDSDININAIASETLHKIKEWAIPYYVELNSVSSIVSFVESCRAIRNFQSGLDQPFNENNNFNDLINYLDKLCSEKKIDGSTNETDLPFSYNDFLFRINFENISEAEFSLYEFLLNQKWEKEHFKSIYHQNWLCLSPKVRKELCKKLKDVLNSDTERWQLLNKDEDVRNILENMEKNIPEIIIESTLEIEEYIHKIIYRLFTFNEKGELDFDPLDLRMRLSNNLGVESVKKSTGNLACLKDLTDNQAKKLYTISLQLLDIDKTIKSLMNNMGNLIFDLYTKPIIEKLRKKYIDNPPEGMTAMDICNMSDGDLLDMYYFLN